MKKLIVIATISLILLTPSLALGSDITTGVTVSYETNHKPSSDDVYLLYTIKQQLEYTQKLYNSIIGSRTKSRKAKQDDGGLYFLKPEFIYDNEKQTEMDSKIPSLFRQLMQKENYLRDKPLNEARELIDERFQYATLIDKVVTLRTFEETENRFEQITKLLIDLDKLNDLKGIVELRLRMKNMLAMIKNEKIKLQMFVHLRNSEQALINRLKRKRNVQILGSVNKQLPTIRSQ
ncbi:type IV secretion system protein VirB5 [Bartonella callosciuri]|uniref:Type IV secretion system protein VirB5 n=1 Tax=Bartonella callosciuri TaxID=686223 RepID=A0A840NSN1_9HYPH|nr:type IV secretion system protein [Bartonella callosciuri]MBB5074514.1 type IV secretion system protein VirB5 [Bartonella callosciuri]